MKKYKVSRAEFYTERLENYKWSYLDNYICSKGESAEFPLEEVTFHYALLCEKLNDIF